MTRAAATTSPNRAWEILEPLLLGGLGKVGRPARNNRRFSNAVFRVFGIGTSWRDLPPDYGNGCATHRRFSRWRTEGTWARPLDAVSVDPDWSG